MSVSDSLVFKPKPASISRTTHRQSVPSYNGTTFSGHQTILLNIPCGRQGHYLNTRMSYLRFKVVNTSIGGDLQPDYTAASFIQSMSLYHGSNLLEQIHEYNALYHMMYDLQADTETQTRAGNILHGSSNDTSRTGTKIEKGGSFSAYYCIPIPSGIIGPLQSKYLPTGIMTGGDLRLELTLADLRSAGVVSSSPNAASWEITDVALELEFVEVSSEVDRMIQQANPRYAISFESFANYTNTIAVGESRLNRLIPARFSSLKTLYTMFRPAAGIAYPHRKSVSNRVNPQLKNWYYQVSGENIPAIPDRENVESFAELQKAQHLLGSVNIAGLIERATYYKTDSTGQCSFAIGQNMETMSHRNTLTESGKNTLNTNCYLLGDCTPAAVLQMSTFAHFDAVMVIENGVATSAF
jgi:hypothetical protein